MRSRYAHRYQNWDWYNFDPSVRNYEMGKREGFDTNRFRTALKFFERDVETSVGQSILEWFGLTEKTTKGELTEGIKRGEARRNEMQERVDIKREGWKGSKVLLSKGNSF